MQCTGEQQFLQSPLWEHFLESEGLDVFRVREGGMSGLFTVYTLPIVGKYAYCPRGPLLNFETGGLNSEIQRMVEEAKKRNCGWIRIEPTTEEELQMIQRSVSSLVKGQGSKVMCRAPHDVQPREILCMNIAPSEEELLAQMKPKTRYNIRLAEKKGVHIRVSREEKYQNLFIELVKVTVKRAGIHPHPDSHYRRMFEMFPDEAMQLYSAEYEGKVIAANMVVFFGDTAIYLHGGSGNTARNVMAPFLLQWQAIRDAKARECKWYDLGGIATDQQSTINNQQQKWSGITRFKQGFCPDAEPTRFPGTYDIVLDSTRYTLYGMLSKLRRKL